jgi:hypothetical protein
LALCFRLFLGRAFGLGIFFLRMPAANRNYFRWSVFGRRGRWVSLRRRWLRSWVGSAGWNWSRGTNSRRFLHVLRDGLLAGGPRGSGFRIPANK